MAEPALRLVEDDDGSDLLFPHPTEEQQEALYQRHTVLLRVDVDGHTVLCRKLRTPEYQRIMSMANDPARMANAGSQMFQDCVVYPEGEALKLLVAEYPGAAERCAEDLLRWTRGETLKQGKKSRRRSKQDG